MAADRGLRRAGRHGVRLPGRPELDLGRALGGAAPPGARPLYPRHGAVGGTVRAAGADPLGIERFYVEEGKAIEYERAIGSHDLYADVSITRDGKARLARLVVQR
jgi:hypothetical protein